jgi:hypothetical protein
MENIVLFIVACFAFAQTVDREVIVEDLRFVQQTLLAVHPELVTKVKQDEFNAYVDSIIDETTDKVSKDQGAILAQKIITWLGSAHDRVELQQATQYLPLVFHWASDGLVVFADTLFGLNIPPASEVLKVGDIDTATLELKLQELLPGNRYRVRQQAAHFLPTEGMLRYLGIVDETGRVTVTLRTPKGKEKVVSVLLVEQRGKSGWLNFLFLSSLDPSWQTNDSEAGERIFAWKVDGGKNRAIFKLYKCVSSESYKSAVQRFFEEVEKTGVTRLIVDLRGNGGGDSSVVDAFLSHLPSRSLKIITGRQRVNETIISQVKKLAKTDSAYENLLKNLETTPAQNATREGDVYFDGQPGDIVSVDASEQLQPTFNGKVYIMVDGGTFSAAIDFAVILSDNKLATIVGEPVGDAPTSSGNVIPFSTPNLGISFKVSSSFYVRPDPSRDPADTLEPDIHLPLTVKDIQQKHDPIKEWLDRLE